MFAFSEQVEDYEHHRYNVPVFLVPRILPLPESSKSNHIPTATVPVIAHHQSPGNSFCVSFFCRPVRRSTPPCSLLSVPAGPLCWRLFCIDGRWSMFAIGSVIRTGGPLFARGGTRVLLLLDFRLRVVLAGAPFPLLPIRPPFFSRGGAESTRMVRPQNSMPLHFFSAFLASAGVL